ncbi:MAG: hypothetical protein LBI18_16280 [Planctomycetaceae bacterium]|jgi:hypothetical protein|nr:hypothetical protein [Planctomycetaceae bacterium]
MKKYHELPEITQQNFRALLPAKIAAIVAKICEAKKCSAKNAILEFYQSEIYRELEIEETKYWWKSPAQLYFELCATQNNRTQKK